MTKRIVASLIILALLELPLAAKHVSVQISEAETQAQSDANGGMWLAVGLLTGVVGWLVAYVIEPAPPASSLLGKDPTYVAQYTDAYKRKVKQIRTNKALIGCLIGSAAQVVLWIIIFSSDDYYY